MLKNAPQSITAYFVLVFLFLVFVVLIAIWLRKSFKRKYLELLKKNELTRLDQEQKKLEEEARKLLKENERLSTIIHKDNKLMASMLLSVKELLYRVADEEDPIRRKQDCEQILEQLESASGERWELVRNYEHAAKRLPETGNSRIDSLLSYMNQRAFTEQIAFEVSAGPDFMKEASARISTEDLSTLMADLIENAIIATRGAERRNILVSLQCLGGHPVLAVYDSGVPFPQEVKDAWGRERVTTHADTGGSGIGMMTAYEICKKNQADFLIEEHPPVALYTKCISVTF